MVRNIYWKLLKEFKQQYRILNMASKLLSVVFTVLINGCDFDELETAQTSMELILPTEVEGRNDIDRIRIFIEGEQRDVPVQELKLTSDSGREEFEDINIFIPLDAKYIRVEALGNLGGLLFVGESTVEIENEGISRIRIELDPTTPVLKFNNVPEFVDVGQDFQIEIELKHAKSLFALTLEISYPNVFIEPYGIDLGDFWKNTDDVNSVLLISDYNLTSKSPGRLSLGLTRTTPPDGKIESGKVAIISFHTKQTGIAKIRVLNNPRLAIQKSNGQPIENFDDLTSYLHRAQAELEIR